MLFKHSFIEGTVTTSPVPVINKCEGSKAESGIAVTDMEASGVFHSGALFFQSHQMFFFKIVSDYKTGEQLSQEKVSELVAVNAAPVFNWVTQIHNRLPDKQDIFSVEEKSLLKQTSEALKLTVSMQHQLNQVMLYHKVQYGSFTIELKQFLVENLKEPCKSKNEGKKYFEKLKKRFV